MKTTVFIQLAVDRRTMTVRDLVTGETIMMRADLGVLVQIESGASEGHFDAWVDDDGVFSFGDRIAPPGDSE